MFGGKEHMKKDAESLFKKGLRSVAASVPVAASLSQWWAEMDADLQAEAIEQLQTEVNQLRNPIPTSHPKAMEALQVLYRRIESTGAIQCAVDDELREYLEVLSLWAKRGYLEVQHAIGNRWISIRLSDPVFVMAIFGAAKGDRATLNLRKSVWETIRQTGKGVHGEDIAAALDLPLVYVNSLFEIFEMEGKGWKSKTQGSSYFSPDRNLC
jgi:hypothetical protein